MSIHAITGINVFSVTPIADDQSIDLPRFCAHAKHMIERGVHGLTLFGSTGSNGSFSASEKMAALKAVTEAVDGRVPVMMGIGSITTAEACALAYHAEGAGAAAVLTVPINYWKPTEREICRHYETIADASALPCWIYNNPPLTGVDITPQIVAKLAAKANIVGIKESSGDLSRVLTIPELTDGKVAVGPGYESFVIEAIAMGAAAWFSGINNVAPALCVRIWNLAKAGNFAGAFSIARDLHPLAELISRYGHVRVVPEALDLIGLSVGVPRLPLLPLEAAARQQVARAVACLTMTSHAGPAE